MSLAEVANSQLTPASGAIVFLPALRQPDACAEMRAHRYVVANAASTVPVRGQVRRVIDDAVECALALRGAHPPAVEVDAGAEVTVRDQVFRARMLGVPGLAVILPSLACASEANDRLSADDSEVVAAWLQATERANVSVFLDERDRNLELLMPTRLGDRATTRPRALRPVVLEAPVSHPVVLEASDLPHTSEALVALVSEIPPSGEVARLPRGAAALLSPADDEPATQRIPTPPPPAVAMNPPRRGVLRKRPRPEALPEEPTHDAPLEARMHEAPPAPRMHEAPPAPRMHEAPPAARTHDAPPAPPAPRTDAVERVSPIARARRAEPVHEAARTVDEQGQAAMRVVASVEWRNHALDLDKAKGPKPVAVIEKLFTSRYLPLVGAAARGEIDASVRGVIEEWRASFEHSYRDAFSSIRVTGKRPPMVFDAPDIAARIGRLNGARMIKLMLVDAMRFDIGERVAQMLAERLSGGAVCVERMVLWSALPPTTPTQMALLARGAEGLRDMSPSSDPAPEITRGRAVGTVRRERIGAREVMKLDVVEARVRTAGPAYAERMEALAEEVTQSALRYIETLPPRTLLFLFGDHGFRLGSSADGRSTGPATQGGASPEEVLMPAQAWLIGGVH